MTVTMTIVEGLRIFVGSILLATLSFSQPLDYTGLLTFNQPILHVWSNQSIIEFDPYDLISERTQTFQEYLILQTFSEKVFVFLIFYHLEPPSRNTSKAVATEHLQRHNQAKEYYWAFFNSSGTVPALTFRNTTTELEINFNTLPNDFVRYFALTSRSPSFGKLTTPPFDLILEVPANTRSFLTRRILIEQYSWGYLRWRMSHDILVTWETIRDTDIGLSANTWTPEPEQFVLLQNPCIPDLALVGQANKLNVDFEVGICQSVIFSIITRSPFNDVNRVYLIVPLANQTHWTNATSAFCSHSDDVDTDEECGSVTQVLLTNNHLLGLSNLGLYVSINLNSSVEQLDLPPRVLPVANFKLYNPCSDIEDFLRCFDSKDGPKSELIVGMQLYYTPVCHSYQRPNYRDMVILTIIHTVEGVNSMNSTGPSKSVTILYSDAPYTKWNLLLKSIYQYDGAPILNVAGIFFHHQLNQFDMVLGVERSTGKTPQYDRLILPLPDQSVAKGYYDDDPKSFGDGTKYQVFPFPPSFIVSKVEVFTGAMDVFFLGNQLFIAESGSTLVYPSVSNFAADDNLEYCSFNHPDRAFVCINLAHTIMLVGYVGATYGLRETSVSEINEVKRVAQTQRWIPPYPSTGIAASDASSRMMYDILNMPRYAEAFRHCRFTMSFSGTIQMWYMKGLELKPRTNYTALPDASRLIKKTDFDSIDATIRTNYADAIRPRATPIPAELSIVNIPPRTVPFVSEESHGPLVPFLLDAITTVLYEAVLDLNAATDPDYLNRYISEVNVGNNVHCVNQTPDADATSRNRFTCELYIRHIKDLQGRLPGFRSAVYTFVERSIPMIALSCEFTVVFFQERSNNVTFQALPSSNCDCFKNEHMGSAVYIPGHFSVLLQRSGPFISTGPNATNLTGCASGIATRKANEREEITVLKYSSFLIDMSTLAYRVNREKIHEAENLQSVTNVIQESFTSWVVRGGACIFELTLVRNSVLRTSGGHIIMDLQDSISLEVELEATTQKAQVMLLRPLIILSNSNPRLLHVDSEFTRFEKYQSIKIVVRPTGFGIGVTSLVVRSSACSVRCTTPCALTFIFQIMQAEGRALLVEYPTEEDSNGKKLPPVFAKNIPVNYRPPSSRGVDIPLARNIYNADPSKPHWPDKHRYRISNETGSFKKCLFKKDRDDCDCSAEDEMNDDPLFSDCKRVAFLVKRAKETRIKISYPPIMDPSEQNPRFYLARQHLSVDVIEVNGRSEYSIKSSDDEYLKEINGDRDLNQGNRYYQADNLRITCYGTGLFHFRASLGDFDSFGIVTAHFVLFSEERGLHDVTYLIVMFLTWTVCFMLLFCGFIRVRKRLTSHLPIHGDTTKIKVE